MKRGDIAAVFTFLSGIRLLAFQFTSSLTNRHVNKSSFHQLWLADQQWLHVANTSSFNVTVYKNSSYKNNITLIKQRIKRNTKT